ncbi:MAG: phenylalanine--tRNA ligase subunit beta [Chlamydiales bacterium]|nr:phenylalanine--tRNA ligase subunit beta [Chlamydiales bacterium]
MKLPLSWLREYLPTNLSPEQIADSLTVVGLEVEALAALYDDLIFEIALTPNLVHCASVRGIARELSAITQEPLNRAKYAHVEKSDEKIEDSTSVVVENKEACLRYACRIIRGVSVAPSPDWLKERVESCGMRSVNNIVDITNLVLLEFGHPLHAFDFDTLEEKRIVVRNARKGERLITLDGKERFPTEEMLMICDGKKPIAVAGVMGSQQSEVTEKTTTVLLESAYFEPAQVRRTSKHLGIRSEASYRFERGCDPNGLLEALDYATARICEIAGGRALKGFLDVKAHEFDPSCASLRISRTNQILGIKLSSSEIETILKRLGFLIKSVGDDLIEVEIPTYRHDIHNEIDLIEEVARLYGFDNIHKQQRASFRTGILPHSPAYLFEKEVRARLIGEGLQELLTCDLISHEEAALVKPDCMPSRSVIKLLNPRSTQQSVLRPSLLPGLLNVVKTNADHGIHSLQGFEIGRLHFKTKERYFEPTVVSLILTGQKMEHHWENKTNTLDFFDLKGIVENLLAGLKTEPPSFHPTQYENFHPGRQASVRIADREVGIMGEVHPETLKEIDLHHPVYFAELNLEDLRSISRSDVKMTPLPHYPASSRDWTVTLPEEISVGALLDTIKSIPTKRLESVLLLDVYRSEALGSQRKNVTLRFVYRDRDQTLSVEAVENEHARITQKLIETEDLL